jgi:anti-sigma regulatory factor (Ser/Thr protein kinase)
MLPDGSRCERTKGAVMRLGRRVTLGATRSRIPGTYVSFLLEPHAVDAGQHVVQFYERDADLLARAGEYLSDTARAGGVAIVIATEAHRDAFHARMRDAGVDAAAARDDGTLVWLDAAATLARIMRDGHVDREAFFDVVGRVVQAATASGRPVRAYGEMVALLWEAGNVIAAIELETHWNDLATTIPFSLYCAYPSESVSGHKHADALARVCDLHSAIVPTPVAETTWRFVADATAPGDARRLIIDALRRAGHDAELLANVQIVITELAANAVVHTRSPFSVSIRSTGSIVRIGVRDRSHAAPTLRADRGTTPEGRGMRIVAALSRWGVDPAPGGKVVWAELGA